MFVIITVVNNWVDIGVIILYLIGITAFGCSFYFRKGGRSAKAFMVGGGNIPNWVVSLSLLATFISSISFLALPAKAYLTNWNPYVLSLTVPVAVVVSALVFVPFYRRIGCISAYAYLEDRFGVWARLYASGCFLLMQSARSGVILFLLAILIANVLQVGCLPIILITAIATMVYSMMGGITAVVWTDAIQALILIAGALFCAVLLYCGLPGGFCAGLGDAWRAGKFSLGSLSVTDFGSETLLVTFLYGLCINLMTFGADQCFTQRYATAKDVRGAIRSMIGGYLLYVPVTLLFVVIGTGLWLYVQKNPGVVPAEIASRSDAVFPWYIVNKLPTGVAGLLIAAVIAAAMSTIATTLNSGSTVLLEDYYRRFCDKRGAVDRHLLFLRLANVVITVVSICVAVAVMKATSVLTVWWAMQGILSGGLLGLYLLAFFARRTTSAQAAIATALGTLTLIWIAYGQKLLPLPRPLHVNLGIVLATVVIFISGYLMGRVLRERD